MVIMPVIAFHAPAFHLLFSHLLQEAMCSAYVKIDPQVTWIIKYK